MPTTLETLQYIKGELGFKDVARQIANIYHGLYVRPQVAPPPLRADAANTAPEIPGLSKMAAAVGTWLLSQHSKEQESDDMWFDGPEIAQALQLTPGEVNDAVAELQSHAYVEDISPLGTAPYDFGSIQPTAGFYYKAAVALDYDPGEDILAVCRITAAESHVGGHLLRQKTGIPPARLNRAVELVKLNSLAEVFVAFGSHPYSFTTLVANYKTRQVADNGV